MEKPIVTLDFETYYDSKSKYSLRSMPVFQYVTDPQFKAHGVSVVYEAAPNEGFWVTHDDLDYFFKDMKGFKSHRVVMQNAYFDGLILAHHYNCIPPDIIDTKGMANVLVKPFTNSATLQSIAEFYGEEGKQQGVLVQSDGIRDLPLDLEDKLSEYAIQDSEQTLRAFQHMRDAFPEYEYKVLNMHIQMYLNKRMRIDVNVLEEIRGSIKASKEEMERNLVSEWPQHFKGKPVWTLLRKTNGEVIASIIKEEGLLPPRKRSPTSGKLVYAFAKDDLAWQAMRSHSDKMNMLVDAKAMANSSILENRLSRLKVMHDQMDGWAHPLLNYSGARTGRSSGGDKLNFQNMPKKPENFRHMFTPPKGGKVIICDSGQIEARVLSYVAGQEDLLDDFRESDALVREGKDPKALGKDVYTLMAKKIGSDNRQLGKTVVLGCGFGMGEKTFILNAKANPFMDVEESVLSQAWNGWRMANPNIVNFWYEYEAAFAMCALDRKTVMINGIKLEPHPKKNGVIVWLPSGRPMIYGGVHKRIDGLRDKRGKLWFGTLVENLVQAIARDVVFYQTLDHPELVERLWLMVHDEINLVAEEKDAEWVAELSGQAFSTAPEWWKGIPVIGEPCIADHLIKA